jgi:hypothetical protein
MRRVSLLLFFALLVGCASASKVSQESYSEAPAEEAAEPAAEAAESSDAAPIFRDTPYDPARFAARDPDLRVDRAARDTLSLPWDGDTAAFDFLERALNDGYLPPAGALRAAELVNALAPVAAACPRTACLHTAAVRAPHRADRVWLVAQLVAGDAPDRAPVTVFLDDQDPAAAQVQTRGARVVRRTDVDLGTFLDDTDGSVALALSAGLSPLPDRWRAALARRSAPVFLVGFGEHQDRTLDHMSALAGARYAYRTRTPATADVALTRVALDVQLSAATRRWTSASAPSVQRGAFLLGGEAATWTLEVEPSGAEGPLARVTARYRVADAASTLSADVEGVSAAWAERAAHAALLADALARRDADLLDAISDGPLAAYAARARGLLDEEAR